MILDGVHLLLIFPCTAKYGSPAELAILHGLEHEEGDADACPFCDAARPALRSGFPEILGPDAMYGVPDAETGQ